MPGVARQYQYEDPKQTAERDRCIRMVRYGTVQVQYIREDPRMEFRVCVFLNRIKSDIGINMNIDVHIASPPRHNVFLLAASNVGLRDLNNLIFHFRHAARIKLN